jgi:hypothetical protein
VLACEADARGRKGLEDRDYPRRITCVERAPRQRA